MQVPSGHQNHQQYQNDIKRRHFNRHRHHHHHHDAIETGKEKCEEEYPHHLSSFPTNFGGESLVSEEGNKWL